MVEVEEFANISELGTSDFKISTETHTVVIQRGFWTHIPRHIIFPLDENLIKCALSTVKRCPFLPNYYSLNFYGLLFCIRMPLWWTSAAVVGWLRKNESRAAFFFFKKCTYEMHQNL